MDLIIKSAADLRYLLDKGYSRAGALTFVGNRYQLSRAERELLNRGVYPDSIASARRAKLVRPEQVTGRPLGIDGYNVLITLESAYLGRDIIAADDGLIRDTAGLHSSYRQSEATAQALKLILNFLKLNSPESTLFLLDAPMSYSGELASRITSALAGQKLPGQARAVPVPEKKLYNFAGLVATSDSVVIDNVIEPFDLAGHLIKTRLPDVKIKTLRGGDTRKGNP
ncbi:MAG: DUF434 domain-containing protein [Deltaproteobacteria bacterium]|nr:DUF434 domain-containing protein [Deltaproteobacteria bacterium]MBW2050769.1 DUF434 domain-containing protein [Deltaproteobacteria bacterium]MBW2141365.1 DUF434 domain-containing protein [Deltaproteobacteria bacterium]MBW2321971.1 DUF434 domain-containing protein [Deltaproteobacteria bacterium]